MPTARRDLLAPVFASCQEAVVLRGFWNTDRPGAGAPCATSRVRSQSPGRPNARAAGPALAVPASNVGPLAAAHSVSLIWAEGET
jgi:hypothetical protein